MSNGAPLLAERDGFALPRGNVVVVGFARTGQAVARALASEAARVTVVDDAPSEGAAAAASALGVAFVEAPAPDVLAQLARAAELVVVSPGVAPRHPVFSLQGVPVISEIELASRLSTVPIVAVTGTNGKTTVTVLVAAMLEASGIACAAVGNIGAPLIEAVREHAYDALVVEVSSFQLALTSSFHPSVATWLNLAEDHLDWHASLEEYAAAKAKILANLDAGDTVVANANDRVVLDYARRAPARLWTFGAEGGDYHLERDELVGPDGEVLADATSLARRLPHDLDNALAAAATARAAGATIEGCRAALSSWQPLAHRVELVETLGEVGFYDDSKATTPSSVAAALAGFSSVVLIAGGRNKGLDLSVIADAPRAPKAVIAIGEAADELLAVFATRCEVVVAPSMSAAVQAAWHRACPGDAVLLSPGCASFDWYRSYEERGNDFADAVRTLARALAQAASGTAQEEHR